MISSLDTIDAFPDYRPTLNNKLKSLKIMEFLHERLAYHLVGGRPVAFEEWPRGAELCGVLRIPDSRATRENSSLQPPFRIIRRGRSLNICIYRNGQRIFPSTSEEAEMFWVTGPTRDSKASTGLQWIKFDLQADDIIFLCRGYASKDVDAVEKLNAMARAVEQAGHVGDYDKILPYQGYTMHGDETGCLVARVGNDFDECIERECKVFLRHLLHWEKNGEVSIENPWSYAITKHSILYRPYLAMLYLDASKINRFNPTIEFIIRKVRSSDEGTKMQPLLGKLSEIQHMAGAMVCRDRTVRLWATSGAVPIHIHRQEFKIYGEEGWAVEGFDVPLTEFGSAAGDFILLLSPTVKAVWELDALRVILRKYLQQSLDSFANRQNLVIELSRKLPEEGNSKHGIALFEIADDLGGKNLAYKS